MKIREELLDYFYVKVFKDLLSVLMIVLADNLADIRFWSKVLIAPPYSMALRSRTKNFHVKFYINVLKVYIS